MVPEENNFEEDSPEDAGLEEDSPEENGFEAGDLDQDGLEDQEIRMSGRTSCDIFVIVGECSYPNQCPLAINVIAGRCGVGSIQ